jgi:CheY-like chemotaxis protein
MDTSYYPGRYTSDFSESPAALNTLILFRISPRACGTTVAVCHQGRPHDRIKDEERTPPRMLADSISKRLLIVDDDPDIRQVLQDRLESFGYTVETAGNAFEAVLALGKTLPNGILLDFMLPVMDGLQVLQEIRRLYPMLPVVIITANEDERFAARAMAAGADEVLFKSVENEHFKQVVQRCFGAAS